MTAGPGAAAGFCGRPGLVLADGIGAPGGATLLAEGTGGPGASPAGAPVLAEGTGPQGHVWVHAADARAHDFHAGIDGDFAVVGAALRDGRATAVSTALTRSSLRTLAGMPAWLGGLGVAVWRIVVPSSATVIDGVTPRLAVALPYALQALALAERRGIAGWIAGAPHCLLGPFRGAALAEAPRAYAGCCAGCPARLACPGVDTGYLERFAAAELSPRALRPAADPPRAGRDMFAGTGRCMVR